MCTLIVVLLLVCQTCVNGLILGLNTSTILHTIASWSAKPDVYVNISDHCSLNLKDNSSVRCWQLKKWDLAPDSIYTDIIQLDVVKWKFWKIRKNEFCNENVTCLSKLNVLRIRDSNRLSWIKNGAFDGLNSLVELIITNTRIKQFIPYFFAGLNNLKRLALGGNKIRIIRNAEHDSAAALVDPRDILSSLEVLEMDNNPLYFIADGFFSTFNTDKLRKISLRSCYLITLGNQSFCTLKSLQVLELNDNPNIINLVADAFQCPSSNYSGLAELSLSKNKMTSRDIASVLQGLNSSLNTVILDKNTLGIVGTNNFPLMKGLGMLSLNFCKISRIMSRAFMNLPNLQELHLKGNFLLSLPASMDAPNLLYLNLDRNRGHDYWKPNSSIGERISDFFHFKENIPNLPKLRKLTMNWVVFQKLNRTSFRGLFNLTTLELKHTTMQEIEDYTFEETPRLASLDLSGNRNLVINTNKVFSGLFRLKVLNLSKYSFLKHLLSNIDNVEQTIFAEAPFQNLYGLSHLDLTGHDLGNACKTFLWGLFQLENLIVSSANITTWRPPLFTYFPILRQIDFSFNDIEDLSEQQIHDLRSMDVVNLAFNPLSCSCSMLTSLEDLIRNSNVSLTHLDSHIAYRCQIDQFDETVPLTEALQYYEEGCSVREPYTWVFRYGVLLAPLMTAAVAIIVIWRRRNLYYISYLFYIKFKRKRLNSQNNVCTYDAFVCYSDHDGNWLYGEMQKNLESRGIQLCLRERDFILGRSKIENLIDAVERSKKIVLVLSSAFANSRWCLFEADIAQQRLVQDAATNIVVVNLEHIHSKALPSYLRYIVKTRTHINWPSDLESRPLFWAKLVRSIRKNSVSVSTSTSSISSEA